MAILNSIVKNYRKLFESGGDPASRNTFSGELNYDSGKYFIGMFIALFIWLPYISLDENIHRYPGAIMYFRLGLTLLSAVLIVLKLTRPLRDRPYISMAILMGYLFIATPILTAMAGGAYATAYIGGYTYVIMLMLIFPLTFRYKLGLLICSLAVFFAFAFAFGLEFSNPGIRYTLNDMVGGVIIAIVFSNLNNRLRYNSWEQKKIIDEQNKTIMGSINYASKIQRNLLLPDAHIAGAFSDFSVIWEPRDVVGGDIYWVKQFDSGTVLCVCDCTGHGTPGALLTMLVVTTLDSVATPENCGDTADIIWKLDRKMSAALHVQSGAASRRGIMDIFDGCDIAVLFAARDGSVRFSSGKMPVFVCDGNEVAQHKGQRISVGEGKLGGKDEIAVRDIPPNPGNKFYVASDGLFDQIGGERGRQFGYRAFKRIILASHSEGLAAITAEVWDAFEQYRGAQARRDDVELLAFKP